MQSILLKNLFRKNIILNERLLRGFCQQVEVEPQDQTERIKKILSDNKVVLFMKGVPQMPGCSYSQLAVEILKFYKIKEYKSIDIIQEQEMKEALKEFSQWPTFPQLYYNSKLVGGSDILLEMHKDGSLKELVANIKQDQEQ